MEKNVQATNDLRTLATAYKNAPSKNLKTQIFSLYALNYTNHQLKKFTIPLKSEAIVRSKKRDNKQRKTVVGYQLRRWSLNVCA